MNSKLLPENIRRCMPKEDRKELATPTISEANDATARRQELDMHKKFEDWCRIAEVVCIHCRTDRKSTIAVGHPDFTLLKNGRGCCVEFKAPGGSLRPEQETKLKELDQAKVPWLVTQHLECAIGFTKEALGMPPLTGL